MGTGTWKAVKDRVTDTVTITDEISALRVRVCVCVFFFLMIRRPPRCTQGRSSAASDVYKGQTWERAAANLLMTWQRACWSIIKKAT